MRGLNLEAISANFEAVEIILNSWNLKQQFFIGCFNWMMNQIFTWEMVVSPNIRLKLVV